VLFISSARHDDKDDDNDDYTATSFTVTNTFTKTLVLLAKDSGKASMLASELFLSVHTLIAHRYQKCISGWVYTVCVARKIYPDILPTLPQFF